MTSSAQVAMVAALEREVRPLVKKWRGVERDYAGRRFKFFESEQAVLVCGGIGAEAARWATEAVIALYQPEIVQSVGFAGGLVPALKVGDIFIPSRVLDAGDASSAETGKGAGVLVSAGAIAGADQKAKLAASYGALAVDMEAAAVARGAETRGVRFMAVKSISDEYDFAMPPLDDFVDPRGRFRTRKFVISVVLRPWLWGRVIQLGRNGRRASDALCGELKRYLIERKKTEVFRAGVASNV